MKYSSEVVIHAQQICEMMLSEAFEADLWGVNDGVLCSSGTSTARAHE